MYFAVLVILLRRCAVALMCVCIYNEKGPTSHTEQRRGQIALPPLTVFHFFSSPPSSLDRRIPRGPRRGLTVIRCSPTVTRVTIRR